MASVSDLLHEYVEEPFLERQGGAYEAVLRGGHGPEAEFDDVERETADRAVLSRVQRQPANSRDLEAHRLTLAAATSTPKDASPAGDLVNAYFAQMGAAEWLSREEEIALAKRIEVANEVMLRGFCQVPMLVGRIAQWARAFTQGWLRLAQFADLSMSDEEPRRLASQDDARTEGTGSNLTHDDAVDGTLPPGGDSERAQPWRHARTASPRSPTRSACSPRSDWRPWLAAETWARAVKRGCRSSCADWGASYSHSIYTRTECPSCSKCSIASGQRFAEPTRPCCG